MAEADAVEVGSRTRQDLGRLAAILRDMAARHPTQWLELRQAASIVEGADVRLVAHFDLRSRIQFRTPTDSDTSFSIQGGGNG